MRDETPLIARLHSLLGGLPGLTERKMMGGHCLMVRGNMVGGAGCSEAGEARFMLRVGKANTARAEALPGGEPLVKGGRRMGGMYLVDPDQPAEIIDAWVALAVGNALSLPEK